ncbi:hypothetical protein ASD98_12645 [Flavobacterium sp. Root186]|nr:hypothetical protein ASD98_12645 [Flavobacterium sp. Root186]
MKYASSVVVALYFVEMCFFPTKIKNIVESFTFYLWVFEGITLRAQIVNLRYRCGKTIINFTENKNDCICHLANAIVFCSHTFTL